MLEFKDVSFRYPGDGTSTLDGLSFRVERGEFVSVIGPSGCGKSTIFRLASCLLTPDAGVITVNGRSIAGQKNYCGYMPQSDLLFPWRTVAENVRLPLEIRGGLSKGEMDDETDRALEAVGLAGPDRAHRLGAAAAGRAFFRP